MLSRFRTSSSSEPAAERFDFAFERDQPFASAARDHEVGASFRECARHVLPEAAARSSNQGNSAFEAEQVIAHEVAPGVSTTFIKLGSLECKRSNQRGPSPEERLRL